MYNYNIDVAKIKGKMAERDISITKLARKLDINRNTLSTYLKEPKKMPFNIISKMATMLCDNPSEAHLIFFISKLTETQEKEKAS